jgi:hypothetical protein
MIVYDFASKQVETLVICLRCFRWMLTSSHRTVQLEGELTSVKVSADSRYAIINHAPDVGSLAVSFIYLLLTQHTGGSALGPASRPHRTKVHRPTSTTACPPQLLWRRGRQLRRLRLRGCERIRLAPRYRCTPRDTSWSRQRQRQRGCVEPHQPTHVCKLLGRPHDTHMGGTAGRHRRQRQEQGVGRARRWFHMSLYCFSCTFASGAYPLPLPPHRTSHPILSNSIRSCT